MVIAKEFVQFVASISCDSSKHWPILPFERFSKEEAGLMEIYVLRE